MEVEKRACEIKFFTVPRIDLQREISTNTGGESTFECRKSTFPWEISTNKGEKSTIVPRKSTFTYQGDQQDSNPSPYAPIFSNTDKGRMTIRCIHYLYTSHNAGVAEICRMFRVAHNRWNRLYQADHQA